MYVYYIYTSRGKFQLWNKNPVELQVFGVLIGIIVKNSAACLGHLFDSKILYKAFLYQPCTVHDLYRGIYIVVYIFFVYNGTSITCIITVNNFRFFTDTSETL